MHRQYHTCGVTSVLTALLVQGPVPLQTEVTTRNSEPAELPSEGILRIFAAAQEAPSSHQQPLLSSSALQLMTPNLEHVVLAFRPNMTIRQHVWPAQASNAAAAAAAA